MNTGSRLTGWIVGAVALGSVAAIAVGMRGFHVADYTTFALLLSMALAASRLRISMPGLEGSMSVNLPFILIALAELSLGEALLIAGLSTLVQCLPHDGYKMRPVQFLFNTCTMINATAVAGMAVHQAAGLPAAAASLTVVPAAALFFLSNTIPVAFIMAVTEDGAPRGIASTWREIFGLTFPYFVLSTGVARIVIAASTCVGWCALCLLPVMYGVYRSYRAYWAGVAKSEHPPARADGASA